MCKIKQGLEVSYKLFWGLLIVNGLYLILWMGLLLFGV
jgi:hypothetical protein